MARHDPGQPGPMRRKQETDMKDKLYDYPGTVIKGIDIPFGDLVVLLIKLALASIPAGLIVGIIYLMGVVVFTACTGALSR